MKIKNLIKCSVIAFSLTGFASFTFASGSAAVGSAQTGDNANYGLGKRVYKNKFACKSCPMSGTKLNKDSAETILSGGVDAQLTSKEQTALAVYLKRRFRL